MINKILNFQIKSDMKFKHVIHSSLICLNAKIKYFCTSKKSMNIHP